MGGLGRGVLLIAGLSFLSGCASYREHLHNKYYGDHHQCISAKDKRNVDRLIDEALFEIENRDTDGLTRTMRRLKRERFKRKIIPCKKIRNQCLPAPVTRGTNESN